jgi:hypothetical protein
MYRIEKNMCCYNVKYNGDRLLIRTAYQTEYTSDLERTICQNVSLLSNLYVKELPGENRYEGSKEYFKNRGWQVSELTMALG